MRLQAKLLGAIVPAIALAVLALAWVVFTQLREGSEADLLRQMQLVTGQTREQTDAFLDTTGANARLFASSAIVERYIRVESEEERFELMQPAVLELFATYRRAYPSYTEIQLLLPDGYEDTRLGRPGSVNLTDEEGATPFFRAMAASGGEVHSAFLSDPDTGRPVFKFGRRVLLLDRTGDPALAQPRLYGYLVVTAELPFLRRQVARERIGRTGYLLLVDGAGTIVEHPDRTRIGSRIDDLESLVDTTGGTVADGRRDAGRRPVAFEGTRAHLDTTWLHDNLLLVTVLPEAELQAVTRDLARSVAAVTLAAIVLATAFFWILLRVLVLTPLAGLQRTAVAIGNGEFDPHRRGRAPREDELGQLERAFHDMSVKLTDSMAELHDNHARIHELAFTDSLTGLANRRQVLESLGAGIHDARGSGARMAVLFLDLDGFKKINDLLGHEAGDELLLTVAARLRDCLRTPCLDGPTTSSDRTGPSPGCGCIGRIGGDEFTALVPGIGGTDDALAIAARVLDTVSRPMEIRGQQVGVSSSIGVSLYPDHADDADGLLACADAAMYTVKHQTKNGVRLYDRAMQVDAARQAQLEADLVQALEHDEFHLVFQPQIGARSGRLVGVEALVRWQHPEHGAVPPDRFIPSAEQTGLIEPLGAWVIDAACRQWRAWSELGLDPVRVAINVSQRQFVLQDVIAVVEATLGRYGMPARALEVEITESCMMEAPSNVLDTLHALRRLGVRVAMDDFGTGHSSLALLASMPIDTLKIDRGFVTGVHADTDKGSIMSAVLSLSRDLGLETVAEGVETEEERTFLVERDCEVLQGYLLSRPLAVAEATDWLAARQPGPLRRVS